LYGFWPLLNEFEDGIYFYFILFFDYFVLIVTEGTIYKHCAENIYWVTFGNFYKLVYDAATYLRSFIIRNSLKLRGKNSKENLESLGMI
jgi:hypothetical protein